MYKKYIIILLIILLILCVWNCSTKEKFSVIQYGSDPQNAYYWGSWGQNFTPLYSLNWPGLQITYGPWTENKEYLYERNF